MVVNIIHYTHLANGGALGTILKSSEYRHESARKLTLSGAQRVIKKAFPHCDPIAQRVEVSTFEGGIR